MTSEGSRLIRTWLFIVLVLVAGLLAFGYYLQYAKDIIPCPLCILQRLAYFAVGFIAIAGLLHNPKTGLIKIYTGLIAITSLVGGSIAARQIWLQQQPKSLFSECSSDLNYMLESLPLSEVFKKLFYATGDCAEVTWQFLDLSIAQWSAIVFTFMVLSAIIVTIKKS